MGLRGCFGVEGVLTTSCSQEKTLTVNEVLENTSSLFSVTPSALVLCNRYKSCLMTVILSIYVLTHGLTLKLFGALGSNVYHKVGL